MGQTQPLFLTSPIVPAPSSERRALTARVKQLAAENGLTVSSVTAADSFPGLADHLERHIVAGRIDGLDWFTRDRAAFSADPRNLQASARSVLSVGVAYWSIDPGKPEDGVPRGRISRYARGMDYHTLLKTRMRSLHATIEAEVGRPVDARFLVDTARIVDRAVAARSGLGWYGKHACIIVPGHGSWVLLGELLLDVELESDAPLNRDCGRCTICLDRCPTGAIVAPYTIDTPRCLSFQTIEQRGPIPRSLRPSLGDWVYGCDVCQDVCPYTRAAVPEPDPDLLPRSLNNAYPSLQWLLAMTEQEFRETYRGTPVLRAKRRGLARNAAVALGNVGSDADVPHLIDALETHDEPLVRGHAAWALGRLGGRRAIVALERCRTADPDESVREEIEAALSES
ncbi:MAG: epoxyqueuosine reductase [Thermomicrobiales bacterium]|jgi:epoxyqueuosine reductase|nr:epoxyqueuosine reductase [Thermomicrobiales bacterium]